MKSKLAHGNTSVFQTMRYLKAINQGDFVCPRRFSGVQTESKIIFEKEHDLSSYLM